MASRRTKLAPASPPEREPDGRFRRGCKLGPGNPHVKRTAELQAAIREAVEPRMVQGVFRKLTRMALEGDVAAAKVLLDRVLGKPRAEASPAPIELPDVRTATDVAAALGAVLAATASGDISADEATRYAAVLELTRRSIESAQFEERLRRLEERDAS